MKIISSDRLSVTSCLKPAVSISAALILAIGLTPSAQAASFADFIFVVDESGSMSGEHSWLGQSIGELEFALRGKGVGVRSEENRYGLIGFGGGYSGTSRSLSVGGNLFGSASELATATNSLVTNGAWEDGYSAIDYALNNYSFRDGAAVNFVLITDEDRDIRANSVNFNSILNGLQSKNALLNVVVNHQMFNGNRQRAIGADAQGNAFIADGSGGFTTTPNTGVSNSYSFGTTKTDYVNLAWATGNSTISGAAWDLNLLRAGGKSAQSFTTAFSEIKATEAWKQTGNGHSTQVPEPTATLGLLGLAALGLRKRMVRRSI
ncbi:vWA domain-containing protein [Oscillatoria sp. HE19RPO]|uniref:vWA domain-containing protein n=1 Tax=Oscillatoria sp. HE19RPO TaxID=2954806 RepID=UPI0020C555F6|nr:vWA domain-containing protein [Oscillatoria sp. HE19RPO]